MALKYKHWEKLEKNAGLLAVLIAIMVSFGGLAEILPLFNDAQTVKPSPGVKPYSALRLAGRDVYVREGCYQCHSQMIRTLRFETQRYGRFSEAGESVYDRPFQWGSKRTGPDLARVGGKYSDAWQRAHLLAHQAFVVAGGLGDRHARSGVGLGLGLGGGWPCRSHRFRRACSRLRQAALGQQPHGSHADCLEPAPAR